MKPTIGRIVLFTLPAGIPDINGARTFPAIITAVHSAALVNLRMFADWNPLAPPTGEWKTSVPQADAPGTPFTWCWPPRES